ncbi:MAG: SRPBCC domain-containing protein [Halobacteriota archaeon]
MCYSISEFSSFDGWASGTTLELIPDKKIMQKWRAAEWPEGHYSTVTFELQTKMPTRFSYCTERPMRRVVIIRGCLPFLQDA